MKGAGGIIPGCDFAFPGDILGKSGDKTVEG